MKKSLIAAASAATLALLAPGLVQAQEAASKAGVYGNLNLGILNSDQADIKVIQGRLGYRFNNWVGVEGELATGLGSDKDTIEGIEVSQKLKHSANAYVVGFAPIGPNTDLLARVGYGTTKAGVKAAGISASESEESFNFGVGAQHHFDGLNGIRADFTRQDLRHDKGHANVWTVGYSRRF